MNSEMQKLIEGFIEDCRRTGVPNWQLEMLKHLLCEFKEYCDKKAKAEKEKARLYMASKL